MTTIAFGLTIVVVTILAVAFAERRLLRDAIASKSTALHDMVLERDYWRKKAELLIDAALVRSGAIHQPTMETREAKKDLPSAISLLSKAFGTQEIDSSKRKETA